MRARFTSQAEQARDDQAQRADHGADPGDRPEGTTQGNYHGAISRGSMGGGFQFLDLIFFAAVAVFLVMRLRSVLGRRTGTEQRRDPFAGAPAEGQPAALPARALPDLAAKPAIGAEPPSPLAVGIAHVREADPSFEEAHFAAGARAAFEMILHAFA